MNRLIREIKDSASSSTLHGLPKIVSAKQRSIKLAWAIFITISIVLGILLITLTVIEFTLFDVFTKTKTKNFSQLSLPGFTFCLAFNKIFELNRVLAYIRYRSVNIPESNWTNVIQRIDVS